MKKIFLLFLFLSLIGYNQEQIKYALVKDQPFNSNQNLNLELASWNSPLVEDAFPSQWELGDLIKLNQFQIENGFWF